MRADTARLARAIRAHVLRMTHDARSSHVACGLSVADILATLYGGVLRYDAASPDWQDRDRLVLSKGHAAAALYAVLAEVGFIARSDLATFCRPGSPLEGHANARVPGVEATTGSLGHGLGVGAGMALGLRAAGLTSQVYVALSDGECDEGATWEAAMFAPNHQLGNLTAIVDSNGWQGLGRVDEVLGLEPLDEKWRSFGWQVTVVDGHDLTQLHDALRSCPVRQGQPTAVIARTVKGRGVPFMEDRAEFHYRPPTTDELHRALAHLDAGP